MSFFNASFFLRATTYKKKKKKKKKKKEYEFSARSIPPRRVSDINHEKKKTT